MKLGHHVSKSKDKNLYQSIIENSENVLYHSNFDMNVIGMFVSGPQNYKINLTNDEEMEKIKELPIDIFVHNNYLACPWNESKIAIHSIRKQLEICIKISAAGFIIHLPKSSDINLVVSILPKLIIPNMTTKIYLETPALKPINSFYHNPENINNLFVEIKKIDKDLRYFGICIDTAHIWSSGVDISEYKYTEMWLNELDIPHESILFHLNDNKKDLGIAPDEHEALTHGKIWNKYKDNIKNSGLYAIINFAKFYNIPIILERKVSKLLFNDYLIIQQLI